MKALFFLFHDLNSTTGSPMQIFDERIGAPEPRGYEMRSKSSARKTTLDAPASFRGSLARDVDEAGNRACRLFRLSGLLAPRSQNSIDAVLEEIVSTLVAGEDVKLHGFGNFAVPKRASAPGAIRRQGVMPAGPPPAGLSPSKHRKS